MPLPPRPLVLRFALFVAILAAGVLVLRSDALRAQLELEALTATLDRVRGEPLAAPVYVVSGAILTAIGFPASVVVLSGGAVFGALLGGLLAYAATLGGALVSFALAHTLARDLVVHLLGARLGALEALLERHGFWALFRMRYVPVPFALTNYAAALAGLSFTVYAASTAVALVPVTFLYTYFAAAAIDVAAAERSGVVRNLVLATLAVLALSFLPPRISAWRRRRARPPDGSPPPPPADR